MHVHGPCFCSLILALTLTFHSQDIINHGRMRGCSHIHNHLFFRDNALSSKVSFPWVHNFEEKKAPFIYNIFQETSKS